MTGRLHILVLQGPNLDLLGTREPGIYGRQTLGEIHASIARRAAELGVDVAFFQSNHEGALIDRLHERDFDVAIVNAAGLTHTSVSLRDALLAVERPFIEVHLSDPSTREAFRRVNFLEDIAAESVVGRGPQGYLDALETAARRFGPAGDRAEDGPAGGRGADAPNAGRRADAPNGGRRADAPADRRDPHGDG